MCRGIDVHEKIGTSEVYTLNRSDIPSASSEAVSETTTLDQSSGIAPMTEDTKEDFPSIESNIPTLFEGIQARAFQAYKNPAPCFDPDDDWEYRQSHPSRTGFIFVKPYKTGSSTCSGLNLRIARNVAKRQNKNYTICKARSDHVWASNKYADRLNDKSFMWSVVRDPTARIVSQFFHFVVSRGKTEPTDSNFIGYITKNGPLDLIRDYYLKALSLNGFQRGSNDPAKTANKIFEDYDFIGITERMDESAVALAMLLNVPIGDLLYLTAKGHGGYDDAGGRDSKICTFIWPSFVSSGMQKYLDSDDWKEKSHWDTAFYRAANRSLDLTIDKIGRKKFYENVALYEEARKLSLERCLHHVTFPCSEGGDYTPSDKTSCLWKDSGKAVSLYTT